MNSGSTHIHSDFYDGNIYLWRKDDIEKVLIHEALHSVHYDIDIINQTLIPELRELEKNGFNKLNINEAYTELCAIYLYNILKLSPDSPIRVNRKLLRKHLLEDLEHSLQNCARLLKANNINSIQDLYLQNYKQDAAAFSYIILRTGLLWSLLKKCKRKVEKHTGQSLISKNEIKNCSHNKFAKRIYTDRLECLDDFLTIGFVGRIGVYYQYLLLDIIKNEEFTREIMRRMENLSRKKMILAI